MIRSDTWDRGNSMTRFYEREEDITCPVCHGRRFIMKLNSKGEYCAQECKECDGEGHYVTTVTYPA